MNKKEYIEKFGMKEGTKAFNKDQKIQKIMAETVVFLEKRWKEEFPKEDCTKEPKPYKAAWFYYHP